MNSNATFSSGDKATDLIMEAAYSFQKSRILLTAFELNLFSIIGDDEKSSKEVALSANTNERATERLLDALVSLEFLRKRHRNYSNIEELKNVVIEGRAGFISGMSHARQQWNMWSNLTQAVKTGTSPMPLMHTERDSPTVDGFISAMHYRAKKTAKQIIKMIDLSGARSLIDVGAGSGAYSIEIANRFPDMHVSALDLPSVVPIMKGYISGEGLGERINIIAGDYKTSKFEGKYDIVFLSQILHSNSIWENIDLAKKAYDSLNHGGKIVIQEMILDDNRTEPTHASLFSINMLVATKSGDCYTKSDMNIILREAWFNDIVIKETESGTTLITATKE